MIFLFQTRDMFISILTIHLFSNGLVPIGSMYGIFTYIYHKFKPNVGKYTIHGSYGVQPPNQNWFPFFRKGYNQFASLLIGALPSLMAPRSPAFFVGRPTWPHTRRIVPVSTVPLKLTNSSHLKMVGFQVRNLQTSRGGPIFRGYRLYMLVSGRVSGEDGPPIYKPFTKWILRGWKLIMVIKQLLNGSKWYLIKL